MRGGGLFTPLLLTAAKLYWLLDSIDNIHLHEKLFFCTFTCPRGIFVVPLYRN